MKVWFLNSINYFRGIAILFIVVGHSYGLSNLDVNSIWDRIIFSLLKHGSVYFVFISGFLFHYIFFVKKSTFNYQKYIIKKVKYVFVPYLLISIVPVVARVLYLEDRQYVADWATNSKLLSILWYLATGRIFVGYWYVPTAMILFALAPLFIWLFKSRYCFSITMILLGVSLVIHRPLLNLNPIHSAIYFLPVYLLGMYASDQKQYIYAYMKPKKIFVLGLIVLLALLQAKFWEHSGGLQRESLSTIYELSINAIDINLIQKLLVCFFLMSWLHDRETIRIKSLEQIAQTSFAIYLIHPILMSLGRWLIFNLKLSYEGNYGLFILVGCGLLFSSIAIAWTIKFIFKQHSRYLIGW